MLENENIEQPLNPQLNIGAVSGSLLDETIYLLRISQPENCSKWVEGVGDCGKISCNFCRIENVLQNLKVMIKIDKMKLTRYYLMP